MKKSLMVIGIISIMLIVGLLSSSLIVKEQQFEKQKEKIENVEDFIKGKNIITSAAISDVLYSQDFSTLVEHSEVVVKGRVLSVNYEELDGNAWTKIEFHVNDIFKGDVNLNENIEIHLMGGYITLEDHIKTNDDAFRFENMTPSEIKNTVIKETVDGENEFVKKNEELVLCIVKNPGYYPFPKDSYLRVHTAGMLKLKDNKYVQLYGEVKEKYSISKDKLNDIKNIAVK